MGLPDPGRGHRADGLDEIVDVALPGGGVARRPGGDHPPERRQRVGLRVVAQRQAMLAQLALDPRPTRAGADPRCLRDRVDLQHLVEVRQVDRDDAVEAVGIDDRLDAADDIRAAPVGDHRCPGADRPLQHELEPELVTRQRDHVRGGGRIGPGTRGSHHGRSCHRNVGRAREHCRRTAPRRPAAGSAAAPASCSARAASAPRARRRRTRSSMRSSRRADAARRRTTARPRSPSPSACGVAPRRSTYSSAADRRRSRLRYCP